MDYWWNHYGNIDHFVCLYVNNGYEVIMYRLHIDIPLGEDEDAAIKAANQLMQWTFVDKECRERLLRLTSGNIETVNYRLGYDADRQRSNYLDKNENDHVSKRKLKVEIK